MRVLGDESEAGEAAGAGRDDGAEGRGSVRTHGIAATYFATGCRCAACAEAGKTYGRNHYVALKASGMCITGCGARAIGGVRCAEHRKALNKWRRAAYAKAKLAALKAQP